MNTPTKNLNTRTHTNEGETDVSIPYQNKKNVAQINVGRRPNLSAMIPHNGEPIIIPENRRYRYNISVVVSSI